MTLISVRTYSKNCFLSYVMLVSHADQSELCPKPNFFNSPNKGNAAQHGALTQRKVPVNQTVSTRASRITVSV